MAGTQKVPVNYEFAVRVTVHKAGGVYWVIYRTEMSWTYITIPESSEIPGLFALTSLLSIIATVQATAPEGSSTRSGSPGFHLPKLAENVCASTRLHQRIHYATMPTVYTQHGHVL